jgi:hypothetical protein
MAFHRPGLHPSPSPAQALAWPSPRPLASLRGRLWLPIAHPWPISETGCGLGRALPRPLAHLTDRLWLGTAIALALGPSQSPAQGWLAQVRLAQAFGRSVCPNFAPGFPTIRLSCFSEWQDFTKLLDLKGAEQEQNPPTAATVDEINATVERLRAQGKISEAVFLAIAWHTCGRLGDISQLKRKDIEWQSNGHFHVTFHRGKAVRLQRQPYTVYTKLDRTS